jgi:Uncharacterized BCR, YaiI/YqxD family COG1671
MTTIYLDPDGCPVKDEVYRVAERYKLSVILVANKRLNLPINPLLEMVVVTGTFAAADDWIVEEKRRNVVLTRRQLECLARNGARRSFGFRLSLWVALRMIRFPGYDGLFFIRCNPNRTMLTPDPELSLWGFGFCHLSQSPWFR